MAGDAQGQVQRSGDLLGGLFAKEEVVKSGSNYETQNAKLLRQSAAICIMRLFEVTKCAFMIIGKLNG